MGRDVWSGDAYRRSYASTVPKEGPATRAAEQKAKSTGSLNQLVDPAEFGVVRRSLIRLEEITEGPHKGKYVMTIGPSMAVESRVDTTGSMGGNVDIALEVGSQDYELCSSVLPGQDLHILNSIFGDVSDRFVLCRAQYEMLPEKVVEQLTLMVPERQGGDATEDPQYGMFGGAYLVAAYVNHMGLLRYDFTISDAPARERLSEATLKRVFGPDVFEKVRLNGFEMNPNDLPSTKEVVQDLLKQAHAFFLQVGHGEIPCWSDWYGSERVVVLPSTRLLPQVKATIIGLTEGTLALDQVPDFLLEHNVKKGDAEDIVQSVANIPIGAQVPLREAIPRIPRAGDIFLDKPDVFAGTNIWPIDSDVEAVPVKAPSDADSKPGGPTWI